MNSHISICPFNKINLGIYVHVVGMFMCVYACMCACIWVHVNMYIFVYGGQWSMVGIFLDCSPLY